MESMLGLSELALPELAGLLFMSPLQPSQHPSPSQVRDVIGAMLKRCGGDCACCQAVVAQEAGDHPEVYADRMHWALQTVVEACLTDLALVGLSRQAS